MIKYPFILRDIEITEFDYDGNRRQVHIRYAWYPNDHDVRVRFKIADVDDMIVAAVRRQYPTARTDNNDTTRRSDLCIAKLSKTRL